MIKLTRGQKIFRTHVGAALLITGLIMLIIANEIFHFSLWTLFSWIFVGVGAWFIFMHAVVQIETKRIERHKAEKKRQRDLKALQKAKEEKKAKPAKEPKED